MRNHKLFKSISAVLIAGAMLCGNIAAESAEPVSKSLEDMDEAPVKDGSLVYDTIVHEAKNAAMSEAVTEALGLGEEAVTEADNAGDYLDYGQEEPVSEAEDDDNRAVFGTDTSYTLTSSESTSYPYAAVCEVVSQWPDGSCSLNSGVMVDECHCLSFADAMYDPAYGGWADNIYVIPGDYNDQQPFGYTYANDFTIPTTYKNAVDAGRFDLEMAYYDYGLIRTAHNIGYSCGSIKVTGINGTDLDGYELLGLGYNGSTGYQVAAVGSVFTTYGEGYYRSQMDLPDTCAGGPLLAFDENNEPSVVGILVASNSNYNYFMQMTTDDIQWLNNNM